MTRRELIKASAAGITTLSFPANIGCSSAATLQNEILNLGYIRMKLGDLEILLFSDGQISLNNPQPVFAPEINSATVKEELKRLYLPDDKIESAINIMLIKYRQKLILIDTGSGYHFGDVGGHLLSNLEKAGIKAANITDVLLSHAHIDHIGGIIAEDGSLNYPKAHYHISQKEYAFWMSETPDFSKSKNPNSPKNSIALAKKVLSTIKAKLTLFNDGDVLFSCIKTELADGHTPGHTIFSVFSNDKSINHIVDTVHTQLLVSQPEWGTQWDVDFDQAIECRKLLLRRNHLNRTLTMTTHLPWPGLGYIGKDGDNYRWIPLSYFTPNEIVL